MLTVNDAINDYVSGNAVTLNTSTYTEVAKFDVSGRKGYAVLELLVATQALTSLKITRAAVPSGTHVDLATDAELNTATTEIPYVSMSSAYTAAASSRIQIKVSCDDFSEIGVYAKSNAGTLQLVRANLP